MLGVMLSFFFATRINKDQPPTCQKSYLEGDLALNGNYLTAAVLNRNWNNNFWTISIFVSLDRGNTWNKVKDLMGVFNDGWNMDTSLYVIADPSVSIVGDNPNGFYLIGLANRKDIDSLRMIVFCRNLTNPRNASYWECYNMHEYNPTKRDKPWIIGVPGSSRVIGAWTKEDTVFVLTNDNYGAEGWWNIRAIIGGDVISGEKFNLPYLTYHNGVFYLAVEERNRFNDSVYIHVYYSLDDGTTWNEVPSIAVQFRRRSLYFHCYIPHSGFTRALKGISGFGFNGLAVAYVYGYGRRDSTVCNIGVSISYDGGSSWVDRLIYENPDIVQGNPYLSSSGDTLLVFWIEGVRGRDSSRVMYGWMDSFGWRNKRIASAPYYHSDWWYSCNTTQGNHYTNLIVYRDTVYYYWGGDRSLDASVFSGGGNAWILRGILSEITGVYETYKKRAVNLEASNGGLILKGFGRVYSLAGRLMFEGKGKVSLPKGVYFVEVKGKIFKVIVR